MTASPVIVFEDLQCSDCVAFQRMLDENLLPRYDATVAFEHRDFPLDNHAWATKAAIVARYFPEMDPHLGMQYRRHALAEVKAVDFDGRLDALVEKDVQEGIARGVTRTPTVFVGGKVFAETFSMEEISRAIDQALAEAA